MAWAIVRSFTMRRLTNTFCGPRFGPCSVSDATRPTTEIPAASFETSTRSARSP